MEVKYAFPLSHDGAAVGAGIFDPEAYKSMRGAGVTFFGSRPMAYFVYLGSVAASAGLIVLDYLQIAMTQDLHMWITAFTWAMLGCDALVAVIQFFDLVYLHFSFWPITAITWAGQFVGMSLSSVMLPIYLLYSALPDRDYKLAIASGSLVLHAIFISSQFAVTIEYMTRSIKLR